MQRTNHSSKKTPGPDFLCSGGLYPIFKKQWRQQQQQQQNITDKHV